MSEQLFWMPIMGTVFSVRSDVLNEQWALNNHGQSLRMLADRGGLDASEALAIIERRPWRAMRPAESHTAFFDLCRALDKQRSKS